MVQDMAEQGEQLFAEPSDDGSFTKRAKSNNTKKHLKWDRRLERTSSLRFGFGRGSSH
jgi:hypothetical protein